MSEETKEKRFDDYSQDENVERHTRKNRWVSVDIGGKPWVILLFCFCQLFFRWFLVEIDNSWFAYHFSRARVFLVFPRIPFQKTVWKWKMNVSFVVFKQKESEFFFWTRLIRRRLRSNDWIGECDRRSGIGDEARGKSAELFRRFFFFETWDFFFWRPRSPSCCDSNNKKQRKRAFISKNENIIDTIDDWRRHTISLSLSLFLC